MHKIKKSIDMHAFNEDVILRRINRQADHEGLTSRRPHGGKTMKKGWGLVALSFALVLALGFGLTQLGSMNKNIVTAIVAIDINPSFEVSVNDLNNVLKIDAVNEDAEELKFDDLIGMKVEEAIALLIQRAGEAGFINVDDLDEDFVVVTTISLNDRDEDHDELQDRIQDQIKNSAYLQSLNIVSIKATQREKFEAEGKDIPIGLFVINGYVLQEDGSFMKAGEFFSNPENKEAVKDRVQITEERIEKLRERIEKAIGKLESRGIDVTAYRQRLLNANFDQMLEIQAQIKAERQDNISEAEDTAEVDASIEKAKNRGDTDANPKGNDNAGRNGN